MRNFLAHTNARRTARAYPKEFVLHAFGVSDPTSFDLLLLARATSPPVAYAVMRKNILTALENSYAEQLLAEAEGQRIAANTADATEGTKAFVEKRKAVFTGQ